jgi:hypothetical protein
MSPRPAIFISAVSRELRRARQPVANTLTSWVMIRNGTIFLALKTVICDSHLCRPLGSKEGLAASVLKLGDDFTQLRRGVGRWAAFVAGLLVVSVGLSIWLLQSQQKPAEQQQKTKKQLQALEERFENLQQESAFFLITYKCASVSGKDALGSRPH